MPSCSSSPRRNCARCGNAFRRSNLPVKLALLPKDAADQRNAILEVRAGTGGEEAALFAADCSACTSATPSSGAGSSRCSTSRETGLGGFKEAIASISGRTCSPASNSNPASTACSACRRPKRAAAFTPRPRLSRCFPRPRSRRRRSTTRISHRRLPRQRPRRPVGQHDRQRGAHHPLADRSRRDPAGREVAAQEQGQGAEGAAHPPLRIGAAGTRRGARRRAQDQVGTGDRSERIRTYNFPQGRVTDHRINLTLYKLDKVLNGEGSTR